MKVYNIMTIFGVILFVILYIQPVSAFSSRSDDFYLNLSKQVSLSHNWTYPSYVCHDFSWDLMLLLNRNGFLSSTRLGKYYPCDSFSYDHWKCKHMWVEVWVGNNLVSIEPQTGKVISPEQLKDHYKT
jgi:hypothetical protein